MEGSLRYVSWVRSAAAACTSGLAGARQDGGTPSSRAPASGPDSSVIDAPPGGGCGDGDGARAAPRDGGRGGDGERTPALPGRERPPACGGSRSSASCHVLASRRYHTRLPRPRPCAESSSAAAGEAQSAPAITASPCAARRAGAMGSLGRAVQHGCARIAACHAGAMGRQRVGRTFAVAEVARAGSAWRSRSRCRGRALHTASAARRATAAPSPLRRPRPLCYGHQRAVIDPLSNQWPGRMLRPAVRIAGAHQHERKESHEPFSTSSASKSARGDARANRPTTAQAGMNCWNTQCSTWGATQQAAQARDTT
jgi:hypothetical protein